MNYYKPFSSENTTNINNNEVQSILTSSVNEYEKGHYEIVIENMKVLMKQGELTVWGSFVLGMVSAGMEQYKMVEELFERARRKESTPKLDAKWYIAITYVKLNQPERARALFHELSLEDNKRGNRAARLEKKI